MSFLNLAALAIAALVAGPLLAHLLQRKRSVERAFPPARLVAPSPPQARRRAWFDDRALLATRAASILLLALLGATPLVRCSGLALNRSHGASVALALVVDDSLSMRAVTADGATRFERARDAARQLLAGTREGDAVAIVLAGAPARLALAPTTQLAAARATLDALEPAERATDLDAAVRLADGAVSGLPQLDKRIVLLSDRTDARADGAEPLGAAAHAALWAPLDELATTPDDCAVVRADRERARVRARVVCSSARVAEGRELEVVAAGARVATTALAGKGAAFDVTVEVGAARGPLVARLTGQDAIAVDDAAPVLAAGAALGVGVVADAAERKLETGGAPVTEQALDALALGLDVRPLPVTPDRAEDLALLGALVLDDPPGLSPDARRALAAWVERGGVVLLALGPHAAAASIGATCEPFVAPSLRWGPAPAGDAKAAGAPLAEVGDLHARGRAAFDAGASAEVLARWPDGEPLLAVAPRGRGVAWIVGLPLAADVSDLALRPAFLSLLQVVVDDARARGGARRSEVGAPWLFSGARSVEATGPDGKPASAVADAARRVVTPGHLGAYRVTVDGEAHERVVAPIEREVLAAPRVVTPSPRTASFGERNPAVDASPWIALGLLALLVVEVAQRLWTRRAAGAATPGAHSDASA